MDKKINSLLLLLAGVASLGIGVVPGSARAGNLITNGGFETGDFSGWTQSGSNEATFVDSGTSFSGGPHSGTYYASLGPYDFGPGFLSQSFNDTAGQNLRIEFYYGVDVFRELQVNALDVTFNGASILSLSDEPAHGYTDYVFNETATGNDTLTFGFDNMPAQSALDDVSVSTPEPASLALLGTAFVGFGLLRRRRRGA